MIPNHNHLTGLKSEFSFFEAGSQTQVKESILSYNLFITGRKNSRIHIFRKGITAVQNTNSLIQDLNSDRLVHSCSFPMTIHHDRLLIQGGSTY